MCRFSSLHTPTPSFHDQMFITITWEWKRKTEGGLDPGRKLHPKFWRDECNFSVPKIAPKVSLSDKWDVPSKRPLVITDQCQRLGGVVDVGVALKCPKL